MQAILRRPTLAGRVQVPCSKSVAHRALICQYLAGGVILHNLIWNEDLRATSNALFSLSSGKQELDCGASASTLRFLIPLALVKGGNFRFTGTKGLGQRPLLPYFEMMQSQGIKYTIGSEGNFPLAFEGRLNSGSFTIPGNISSQFVSGLLMALPVLEGESEIVVGENLESKPYVDMTMGVLRYFGVQIINENYQRFIVPGQQNFHAQDFFIEGDYSLGAVWLAAGLLGQQPIEVTGLVPDSLQGDRVCLDLFRRMGGKIIVKEQAVVAFPSRLKGIEIDARDCPDLVPVFAALGCLAEGRTRIYHAGRLRIKESNRLVVLAEELGKLGARIQETEDGLEMDGVAHLRGGDVNGHLDHRIVMALTLASLRNGGVVAIDGAEQVAKSYNNFWDDFAGLGGTYA